MTVQEAIRDLRNDPKYAERVAEDMFTRSRIYGDRPLHEQCVNANSVLSTQWITHDR